MDEFNIYSREKPMTREHFARLYRIMEDSFPKYERRNFEEQFNEFHIPQFRSLVLERDGETAGFVNYWNLSGFAYIEHFAVLKEMRRQGLGRMIIGKLRETIGNTPMVLEVEPAYTGEYAVRRIEFYKHLGFFENDYEYYQPPYKVGDKPLRLMIMSCPAPISESEFHIVRDTIYRDAYQTDFSTK